MLLFESGIERERYLSGRLRVDDWSTLGGAVKRMAEGQIFIDDTPCQTSNDIRTDAHMTKHVHGVELIVIDRVDLVCGNSVGATWQHAQLQAVRALKWIATELDVPVIALSRSADDQENRGESPTGPFGIEERESGKDADVILSIEANRHPTPNGESDDPVAISRCVRITCLKNHHGRTGTIEVAKAALGMH
jgi:replicative DNA helicase